MSTRPRAPKLARSLTRRYDRHRRFSVTLPIASAAGMFFRGAHPLEPCRAPYPLPQTPGLYVNSWVFQYFIALIKKLLFQHADVDVDGARAGRLCRYSHSFRLISRFYNLYIESTYARRKPRVCPPVAATPVRFISSLFILCRPTGQAVALHANISGVLRTNVNAHTENLL